MEIELSRQAKLQVMTERKGKDTLDFHGLDQPEKRADFVGMVSE